MAIGAPVSDGFAVDGPIVHARTGAPQATSARRGVGSIGVVRLRHSAKVVAGGGSFVSEGGSPLDLDRLSFPSLTAMREHVMDALGGRLLPAYDTNTLATEYRTYKHGGP
jgi:hypothetical protein